MNDSELLQKFNEIYRHFADNSSAPSHDVAKALGYRAVNARFIRAVAEGARKMTPALKERIKKYKFPVSDTGGKPGAGASQANDAPPATPQIEMRRLRGRMVPVEG